MLTTYLAVSGFVIGSIILVAYPIAWLLHRAIVSHREAKEKEAAREAYTKRAAERRAARYKAF